MEVSEYNEAVKNHSDSVYRFVLRQLGCADLASDVIQDTFEKLWLQRHQVERKSVKSWLFTIAYRIMIDYIRKNKTRSAFVNNAQKEILLDGSVQNADLKHTLEVAFEQLSPQQKSVLLLRDYEGYDYVSIAQILQLTEPQVKVTLYRARIKMKRILVDLKIHL